MNLLYAVLDANPVIFGKNDAGDIIGAYWYVHNVWTPADSSDVSRNAALLSKPEFELLFPSLPPLPTAAFLL